MKGIGRLLAAVAAVQLGLWVTGRILELRTPQDEDPRSENFELASFVGGKAYRNGSPTLRSGSAVTVFGGTSIDLTGADLDPAGATLVLKTRFGGVKVVVPDGWRVELMGETSSGENTLSVTDPAMLPEDAPRLSVVADTKFGGVLVTT